MLTESDGLTSELVDLLIDKIYVYPDKRVDVEFKIRTVWQLTNEERD